MDYKNIPIQLNFCNEDLTVVEQARKLHSLSRSAFIRFATLEKARFILKNSQNSINDLFEKFTNQKGELKDLEKFDQDREKMGVTSK